MCEFECHADTGQVLVGIFTSGLIRINDSYRWRIASNLIRKMMISDDNVESMIAGPFERFEAADAAINADNKRNAVLLSLFEGRDIYSVTFGFSSAVGFTLAIVIFAGVRARIELAEPPRCFRGIPITLVAAGLLAMAFSGSSSNTFTQYSLDFG